MLFHWIQVRGESDSAYSLADMQELDPQYACTWSDVDALVTKMREEWKVLSICDIVLNHACNNSQWKVFFTEISCGHFIFQIFHWFCVKLFKINSEYVHRVRAHPECTFNCFNCPHLRPAFILDRVLFYFTVDVDNGKWIERGIPKGNHAFTCYM